MKGILRKDLLLAWKNMKYLLFAFVIFAVAVLSQSSETRVMMMGMYLCLIGVLTPLYTFSYDKAAGWDVFARALPVERWKIVLVKYLLGLVFLCAGLLIGGVMIAVSAGTGSASDTGRMLGALAGMMLGGLLLLSVQLPVFYRFGPEKARLLVDVTIFLVTAFCGALMSVRELESSELLLWLLSPSPAAAAALAVIAAALILGSFFLSVRIYERRGV